MPFQPCLSTACESAHAWRDHALSIGLLVCIGFVSQHAMAQSTAPSKADSPWDISLGANVVSAPEYLGSKESAASLIPIISLNYTTKEYGKFSVGEKGMGLAWTAIETDAYSLGIGIDDSPARLDNRKGSTSSAGRLYLKGMGEIKPAAQWSIFGHVNAGVPIMLTVSKGVGDSQPNSEDYSIRGHRGTTVKLGTEIPLPLSSQLTLSIAPSLTWGDKNYNQTYFGVTEQQSARSGLKTLNAKSGVNSLEVGLGAHYQIDPHWFATAGIALNRLQGDAAKSPVVQKKLQVTSLAGLGYHF
jgi:MipA family protein